MKFLSFLILFISFNSFAESNFEKAEKLFQQEKWDQAKVLFEDCIKQNPKDYKSIEYLGDIAGHQKRWEDAIGYYKTLKIQFPKTANYWYKFGGALGLKAKSVSKFKALGMIDEVENAFLTAAKLDVKHVESRWALVMLYIELPGIVGGSEKKANKYADELMQISKVDGYLSKGYIDEYFERYTQAEKNYLKAHEIGNSKTTFKKLYNLYLNKLKNKAKANQLKEQFEK
ncbi:tetratricopeptide repeat protein [Flavobacterium sp. SUN046]|uniref:tetratricopeptide repeat protein n=1 Tax=Flavobacterium sp. SUN046 TaxID=3002440 RepID=UPI002DB72242|nr:tetratricopeptide repeat protein [Flavobacterium sp. SUN046]MEC4049707.1 tetratricopeptide repeat protein [Flavobacterium sp. SUN046]